jgi:hypothetical protein
LVKARTKGMDIVRVRITFTVRVSVMFRVRGEME